MTKKRISLLAVGIVGLIAFIWLWGHSTLVITVNNPSGTDEITYTLTDGSGKSSTFSAKDATAKKVVGRGEYQVSVRQGGNTYTTVVDTGMFLRKTEVIATLKEEAARSFVGANPAFCMQYVGTRLISSECYGNAADIQLHVASTDSSPQYVTDLPENYSLGTLEGMAYTKLGTIALTSVPAEFTEEDLYGHSAFLIDADLKVGQLVKLEGPDPTKLYGIKAYEDGFIVHDLEFREVFYVSSLGTAPVRLDVGAPQNTTLTPNLLNTNGDALAILYAPAETEDRPHGDKQEFGAADSEKSSGHKEDDVDVEVSVIEGGNKKLIPLHGLFSDILPCGAQKLCTRNHGNLEVYDIAEDKPELLYTVHGVAHIEPSKKGLLVVRQYDALLFDVDTQEGFTEYTFGKYAYCGVSRTAEGYVLCVHHEKLGNMALLINQDIPSAHSIDKVILELAGTVGVSNVSVYKELIHVAPDYGEVIYSPQLRAYTYDPAKKSAVDQSISSAVAKLGLDVAPYRVINTGL